MRTFREYVESQDSYGEGVFDLFGKREPAKHKLYSNQEYPGGFAALVRKHKGDERAAEAEFNKLASTDIGKTQLYSMGMEHMRLMRPPEEDFGGDRSAFTDPSPGGSEMFRGKPGRHRG